MTLLEYRIFHTVTQQGSFARAAQILHLTPSAISHAVSSMEEACGFALFVRGKGGVSLTRSGEALYPVIRQVLSADEALNQTVGELKGVQRGKVRIGAFNSVCVTWLPQLVTECRAKYPGVEIEIDQGTYDDVIEWIKTGVVDLGFLSTESTRDLTVRPLYRDRLMCVAPRGFKTRMPGVITPEEMRDVPHHLIDICDAGDFFSMADFQRMAYEAIDGIVARGKLPFLVGGTGLYVASVADGYVLSNKMPDLAYREELERLSTERLYEMLQEAVPATDVEPKNRNRVMRMLEKLHDGDDVTPGKEPRYHTLRLGVTWDREVLRARIDERLERRLAEGMIEEVRGLLNAGVSVDFLKKLGLEYRMITQYLLREIETREEMTTLLANAIKQFAKRQMTWFRRDQSIRWLDMAREPVEEACGLIDAFLSE